jgi:hypothetical protein
MMLYDDCMSWIKYCGEREKVLSFEGKEWYNVYNMWIYVWILVNLVWKECREDWELIELLMKIDVRSRNEKYNFQMEKLFILHLNYRVNWKFEAIFFSMKC